MQNFLTYSKLSALVGVLAAFAAAVISTDVIALDPGLETALIALIAGAAGALFPKETDSSIAMREINSGQ